MQGCDNVSKIEFEGLNFQGYIGKVIVDEFNKCKKDCEIQLILSPCPIKLVLCDEGDAMWDKIKDTLHQKTHFPLEPEKMGLELHLLLSTYRSTSSFCEAAFEGESIKSIDGEVIKITSLAIRIYTDRLNEYIIVHLDSLDTVIESIKLSVRHEFGHILDFIRYHGMNVEKFLEIRNRLESEKKAFYESLDNGSISSIDDLKRYHELEEEATANANVGITDDEKIKYDEILASIDHTKLRTTLTITSEYEPLKEYSAELTITSTHEPIEEEG